MIKLSVLYPANEGSTFDMAYYLDIHVPLAKRLIGAALKGLTVDQGIGMAGAPAPYAAIGHLLFDSIEALQAMLDSHGPALIADVPNYTNVQPTIQVSETKLPL